MSSHSYYGDSSSGSASKEKEWWCDFRSDTVTQPTDEMRSAMASACVGDDVMGEDPTIGELETTAATLFGKEAGLFVPSGTMGNLCALMSHCDRRGAEIIVGNMSHIHLYEGGNAATLAGIHPRVIPNCEETGELSLRDIEDAIRGDDPHYPKTTAIAIENTQNACGGVALTPEYVDAVGNLARSRGLKLHCDGARIANACAALDVAPARIAQSLDSLTVCLSKGLGAPAGTVLLGEKTFIHRALRARKALGGGMRQAGILAAAGLVALHSIRPLLSKDHVKASALASGLDAIPGVRTHRIANRTNMVHFWAEGYSAEAATAALKDRGVLVSPSVGGSVRAVCHHMITDAGVDRMLQAARASFA